MSMLPDVSSARSNLEGQLAAVYALPNYVVSKWPVVITFAVVNTATSYLISTINDTGYAGGRVGRALVNGFAQVITLSTWDIAKGVST